jgi:hypothetical protein
MAKVIPVIYADDTEISTVFCEGTFINYCNFNSPARLVDFLLGISRADYISRVNKTIAIYNGLMKDSTVLQNSRIKMAENFLAKVKSIRSR